MSSKADRIKILKAHVDPLNKKQVLQLIDRLITHGSSPCHLVTLNSLMTLSAETDPEVAAILKDSGLIIADSVGITLASIILTGKKIERIPGIELIDDICGMAENKGWKIFLLGSEEGVAERAAKHLTVKYRNLKIAGYHNGYFQPDESEYIVKTIAGLEPEMLFVGLDVPRQEKWIHENLNRLNVKVAMGIGGSMDIISGKLRRAPNWMSFYGLEWLYRMIQEPWRYKRILHLPEFAWKVIKQSAVDSDAEDAD